MNNYPAFHLQAFQGFERFRFERANPHIAVLFELKGLRPQPHSKVWVCCTCADKAEADAVRQRATAQAHEWRKAYQGINNLRYSVAAQIAEREKKIAELL